MDKIWLVGLGGAIGAILRYGLTFLPFKNTFPIATLLTNVIGAILIGIVVGMFERENISESLNIFLKTGICGGFTTFSTFSLESLQLIESGHVFIGVSYIMISVVGCIIGVFIGRYLVLR